MPIRMPTISTRRNDRSGRSRLGGPDGGIGLGRVVECGSTFESHLGLSFRHTSYGPAAVHAPAGRRRARLHRPQGSGRHRRQRHALGLRHHVRRPGTVERILRAEGVGRRVAQRQQAFEVGGFDPRRVPGRRRHIAEDARRRRRSIAHAVLDPQEEHAALGAGVVAQRAVDQRVGPAAGGVAVGPQALDPAVAPVGRIDIGERSASAAQGAAGSGWRHRRRAG